MVSTSEMSSLSIKQFVTEQMSIAANEADDEVASVEWAAAAADDDAWQWGCVNSLFTVLTALEWPAAAAAAASDDDDDDVRFSKSDPITIGSVDDRLHCIHWNHTSQRTDLMWLV